MNKESCSIPNEEAGQKYVINCAGEKVHMADEGFTARCAIGNTDDYLKSFKDYINPEIVALGEPTFISVVIPSYATTEHDLAQILFSLCSQRYPVSAEILIFINEPEIATENIRTINDYNENFIHDLQDAILKNNSSELSKTQTSIFSALLKNEGNIQLKCVRQVMAGGLAGVYQTVTVSAIARVRTFCDRLMTDCDRPTKIKCIEAYLQKALLLLCDDDMRIKDIDTIARAYKEAVNNDAVVLGKLSIDHVDTIEKYSSILRDLMQLFLDFKYDHGLNFLTPRGILLANILRVGGVKIGQPFADQLFFASAARGKTQYLLEASTSIGESDHPGNGHFLKQLRLYLAGEENEALDIFKNVLKRYQEDKHQGQYGVADIERLISSLKTLDIDRISEVINNLRYPDLL